MNTKKLRKLCRLENEITQLRQQTGISPQGELLFQAPRSMWSEKDVVVEADGLGGAKLLIIEGNYPADYSIFKEQLFLTEEDACSAAEGLIGSMA